MEHSYTSVWLLACKTDEYMLYYSQNRAGGVRINESYPYREQVEAMLRQLNESWAVARNAYDTLTVYLLYGGRFFMLGSPASVAGLSLGALAEAVALAKRHVELGSVTLPTYATEYRPTPPEYLGVPPIAPAPDIVPSWLQQLEATTTGRPAADMPPDVPLLEQYMHHYPTTWGESQQRATVPLARLSVPTPVLKQLLQLPDDWSIKQVSIEEGELCVYCLTPECAWLEAANGMPVIAADYQVEERDCRPWRSPISLLVKQGDYTVGGTFYGEDRSDRGIDL